MVEQSLLHITLNMNHRRRSPRSEVSQEAIDLLSVLIQKPEFPIPGQAAYRCDVFEPGGRCPCFQVLDADGVSLVTFGVGLGVDCSQGLWIALHARVDFLNLKIETQLESPPRTLWLGVLLEPALLAGSPAMEWLGKFYKMPLVVGAGPGAESSGPGCGMGELRGSRIPVCGVSTSFRYTLWVVASRLRNRNVRLRASCEWPPSRPTREFIAVAAFGRQLRESDALNPKGEPP